MPTTKTDNYATTAKEEREAILRHLTGLMLELENASMVLHSRGDHEVGERMHTRAEALGTAKNAILFGDHMVPRG